MRKNAVITVVLVLLMVSLSSCMTGRVENKKPVIIGKYAEPRPEWVVRQSYTDQDYFYGVGFAGYSDENQARKLAAVEAKASLARLINTVVSEVVHTYDSELGATYEILGTQTASAVLSGATVEAEWVAEDGTVFILSKIAFTNIADQLYMNLPKESGELSTKELQAKMKQALAENK